MQHLMWDIETTGKSAGCRVLSIAVVRASDEASFMINLNLDEQKRDGFWDDSSTIQWWADKPDVWRQCTTDQVSVDEALFELNAWCKAAVDGQEWLAWCQGASFDFPIVEALYQHYMIDTPWEYHQKRCARTLFDLACLDKRAYAVHPLHNPLNDALGQSRAFVAAMQIIAKAHQ